MTLTQWTTFTDACCRTRRWHSQYRICMSGMGIGIRYTPTPSREAKFSFSTILNYTNSMPPPLNLICRSCIFLVTPMLIIITGYCFRFVCMSLSPTCFFVRNWDSSSVSKRGALCAMSSFARMVTRTSV